MPSIAQQDYLRPQGKYLYDCHLLAALAHDLEQGTIFDSIIGFINSDDEQVYVRPIAITDTEAKSIWYWDSFAPSVSSFDIDYTQTQYEGLAAIQDADNDYTSLPELETDSDGYLYATVGNDTLVTVGGKKLAVTVSDDDTIAALAISNEEYSGFEITWEDAQNLIGYIQQA